MRLKSIIYTGVLALALCSCEDHLKIDPISDISNSNYWQTADDVKGYMTGAYSNFRSVYDRDTTEKTVVTPCSPDPVAECRERIHRILTMTTVMTGR